MDVGDIDGVSAWTRETASVWRGRRVGWKRNRRWKRRGWGMGRIEVEPRSIVSIVPPLISIVVRAVDRRHGVGWNLKEKAT